MATKKSARAGRIEADELPDELPSTSSGGGPVILLPAEVASEWRGTQPPRGAKVPKGWRWGKSGGPVCDYDRACEGGEGKLSTARGGIGWLDVGNSRGIVLDAELVSVWLPTTDGGIVVRGPDIDGSDPKAVATLVPETGWKTLGTLELEDGRLFLFDSAACGAADPREIAADDGVAVAELGKGEYELTWVTQKYDDFVRFARKGGAAKSAKKASQKRAKSAKKAPAWKLRKFSYYDLPKRPKPAGVRGLRSAKWLGDGTIVGLEKVEQRRMHVLHKTPGGEQSLLTKTPSDYTCVAFTSDETALLVGTESGKLFRIDLPGKSKKPTGPEEVFSHDECIWTVVSVANGRIALGGPNTLHLLVPKGDRYTLAATADVTPNEIPILDVVGADRFVIVGCDKKLYLYAFVNDQLRLVEEYVQTRRGMASHFGMTYFYDSKDTAHLEEVLNFDEVYAQLMP
jgi:hypothetical protein